MNFLHVADLHIGKRVNEFSMLKDQEYVLNQIVEMLEEKDCHGIFIAGDLYDKALPSAEAVALLDDFLTKLARTKKHIFIISGNHDSPERIAYAKELLKKQNIYLSGTFSGQMDRIDLEDAYGSITIYMLPFVRPGQVKKYYPQAEIKNYQDAVSHILEETAIDKGARNILITHQFVAGGSFCDSEEEYVGGLNGISPHIFDDFDYVALGHLHGSQKVARETIRYSGSILKYSFSEKNHNKGLLKISFKEKGMVEIEKKELQFLHDVREIKGSFQELMGEAYSEDYLRVVLTDERMPIDAIGSLRIRFPNIIQMALEKGYSSKIEEIPVGESVEDKDFFALFEDFYQMHSGGEPMGQKEREFLFDLWQKMEKEGL